ncbi:SDR family NAD(P)-dependent oxidoreductase [Nakamurella leprariae]|uniref:SDR family oxidoreductase n=1 Tax=Nakamurella leprariae TaxID=2803911 RepID=A0A938Y845_9ACTN|nr:SDR family NAD(P)-dependent oxidoreductase [Nakamurella leprariae]MBM9465707.1 SDR family oxidoreductase [Nakamurella leprariae]
MTVAIDHQPVQATRFRGRRALVTGAGSGLGAAISERLAAEGAQVLVVDRDCAAGAHTRERIVGTGGNAVALTCDVSDPTAVADLRDRVLRDGGPIDVLVNNAGILRDAPLLELTDQAWDAVVQVNLTAMFYLSRAFVPGMIELGGGSIVNIASRSALGSAGQANYAAAKAGVMGLTATLAIELGPQRIRVNAVGPGFFATPMTDTIASGNGRDPDEQHRAVAARTPLRRVGRPSELAAVVAFLASSDASYVSGQTIFVNGGALTSSPIRSSDED